MRIAGIVFDLDGTLVDSRLNFEAIRRDMGLPNGRPILEALAEMPDGPRKAECLEILRGHELHGADVATLMPGVADTLAELAGQHRRLAVFTRNSREATDRMLARLDLDFATVLTREDAPPKPDPRGLLRICADWGMSADEACFVGDYLFDLQTGRAAGVRTVLYMPVREPDFAGQADFRIRHFSELIPLISQLEMST